MAELKWFLCLGVVWDGMDGSFGKIPPMLADVVCFSKYFNNVYYYGGLCMYE